MPGPRSRARIQGIISDVTKRVEADARAAEAAERFTSLLDVVGEHVYLALAHPDGRIEELFQGPGADRLLGGAEPDPEMVNWEAAIHPDDREVYDAFNADARRRARRADVEYRLRGADGVTRWVHDRAATRRRRRRHGGDQRHRLRRHRAAPPARGAGRRARAPRAHRRAHRRPQPPPLHRPRRGGRPDRLRAAAARRRPLQARQRLARPRGRRRRAGRARPPAAGRARARASTSPAGAARSSRCCCAPSAPTPSCAPAPSACAAIVRAAPIVAGGATIQLTVSIGAVRHAAGPVALDAWIESADHALYAAKGRGRDRVCLAADVRALAERPHESERVTLARAITFATVLRADESESHSQEVADLASLIALQLGLPADTVMRCRLAGWLHDAGKVAIPHAILDKPGPLDDEEWALMRTHPIHSEEIVKRVPALRETAAGRPPPPRALRRHGLPGPARRPGFIPLEARIVAAADAYCAMTAERVYSAAMTPAEAAEELRRCAGTHLDPEVVRALLSGDRPRGRAAPRSRVASARRGARDRHRSRVRGARRRDSSWPTTGTTCSCSRRATASAAACGRTAWAARWSSAAASSCSTATTCCGSWRPASGSSSPTPGMSYYEREPRGVAVDTAGAAGGGASGRPGGRRARVGGGRDRRGRAAGRRRRGGARADRDLRGARERGAARGRARARRRLRAAPQPPDRRRQPGAGRGDGGAARRPAALRRRARRRSPSRAIACACGCRSGVEVEGSDAIVAVPLPVLRRLDDRAARRASGRRSTASRSATRRSCTSRSPARPRRAR